MTNITALMTSPSGATITGTSNLSVDATGTVNLPTLTVYRVGLGTGTVASTPTDLVAAPVAACTGNFVLNSIVTLTATQKRAPHSEAGLPIARQLLRLPRRHSVAS